MEVTTLLLLLVNFIFLGEALPTSDAEPKILTIPTNPEGGVKTLQQMMRESAEEAQDIGHEELEVEVGAQFVDLDRMPKNEELLAPRDNGRQFSGSFAKVTSATSARLELSPTSKLNGVPGETVQVEFYLTNLGRKNLFSALAREVFIPPVDADESSVNFPQPDGNFLVGLSELRPQVDQDETRTIILSLKVPRVPFGTRRQISLEIQPYGNNIGDTNNSLVRRFIFTVGPANPDQQPPKCEVLSDSFQDQCPQFTSSESCSQKRWTSRFRIQDLESGLRSLDIRPDPEYPNPTAFYEYDNFVIGQESSIDLLYGSSCCNGLNSVTVSTFDVNGNEVACSAGQRGSDSDIRSAGLSSTTTIIIGVVVGILVLLLLAAGVAIYIIKRKRKAELEEMRQSPQAR